MGENKLRKPFLSMIRILPVALFLLCTAASQGARASDWRYGFSLGYGGAGISNKQTASSGEVQKVERSEGPLIVDVFVDRLITDSFGITFEHSRGVSLSPASTGVSFTGLATHWYFLGPAPSMVASESDSTVRVQRIIPFAGVAAGIAKANVTRDSTDLFPVVSGTGTYFGMRLGADYSMGPGWGIRPQLVYSTTSFTESFSNSDTPPTLTEFSVQCGWFFTF